MNEKICGNATKLTTGLSREERLELLCELVDRMEIDRSIEILKSLKKENVQDFRILYAKMVLASRQQDINAASDVIQDALEFYPLRAEELKLLFEEMVNFQKLVQKLGNLIESKQTPLVIMELEKLHNKGIKTYQTDMLHLKILAQQGLHMKAVTEFEKAFDLYPQHTNALRKFFGSCFCINYHHHMVHKAKMYLKDYLYNYPNDTEALYYFVQSCRAIGTAEEEISTLERLTQLVNEPNDWFQYAKALGENGHFKKSKRAFENIPAGGQGLDNEYLSDYNDLSKYLAIKNTRNKLARYPASRPELEQGIKNSIQKYVLPGSLSAGKFIKSDTKFFTMGSCFAGNVCGALKTSGYEAFYAGVGEEINSTYANVFLLEWLLNPNKVSQEKAENLLQLAKKHKIDVPACRTALEDTDVLIITLGVAPCFFDKETGAFLITNNIPASRLSSSEKYIFRTTTVEENKVNIDKSIKLLKDLNPKIKIFFTLSPVPLKASFEFDSAVQADCLSKSTLRVAAHEILTQGIENVFYWPSFEIVRWLIPHTESPFGKDDQNNLHVNEDIINLIMELFIENHTGDADQL